MIGFRHGGNTHETRRPENLAAAKPNRSAAARRSSTFQCRDRTPATAATSVGPLPTLECRATSRGPSGRISVSCNDECASAQFRRPDRVGMPHMLSNPVAHGPRSAGFQTCCIADFQIGRGRGVSGACDLPKRFRWPDRPRVWKPATQQTWKSALQGQCAAAPRGHEPGLAPSALPRQLSHRL